MSKVTAEEAQKVFNELAQNFESEILDTEDFNKQLKAFQSQDHISKYKNVEVKERNYLIKVFVYQKREAGEVGKIWMPDLDGSLKLSGQTSYARKYVNLGKVLQVGEDISSPKYSVGDLVILPVDEICGSSPNPDFIAAHQYANSFGAEKPLIPAGIKKELDTIHSKWKDYYFLLPTEFGEAKHLISTFIPPPHKLLAKYNVN